MDGGFPAAFAAAAAARSEFAPQLARLRELRGQISELRSNMEAQRPRAPAYTHSPAVLRETAELRQEVANMSERAESRAATLREIRMSQQADIRSMANSISSAARATAANLITPPAALLSPSTRERQARISRASANMNRNFTPAYGSAEWVNHMSELRQIFPNRRGPDNQNNEDLHAIRTNMLAAAEERMQRRGVASRGYLTTPDSSSSSSSSSSPAARAGRSMYERLNMLQLASRDQQQRSSEALLPQGEPIVDELDLLRQLSEPCSICLEARRKGDCVWVLKCGHCFHKNCAARWLSKSELCPMCRSAVPRKPLSTVAAPGPSCNQESS